MYIVVPDRLGYSTALVFERERRKKEEKNFYRIKVRGKVVYTEKGDVIYTIFIHDDIC